ncbi:MAG TPA: ATP-binding protein [Gemmatimonadaceae bacterium]|nr:ATP-binding protein [Gemmatimonadaceae bacterium]
MGLALQQALDAMSDIYVVYDSSWRFVFQNHAQREAIKLYGIDPDEAMGKVLWDVMPFLAGTDGEAGIKKAMAERVVTEWEEMYPHGLRLHGRAFPTPDGGIAVVARDVTDKWKADMISRAAEERAAALQKTTAALASALTLDRVAEVIVSEALSTIGAHAGSVSLLSEDGMLHIIAAAGYKPELLSEFAYFSVEHDLPISHAVRRAEPVVLRTAEERDTKYPHLVESRRAVGAGAAAAIPMIIDGKAVGGLGFNFPVGRVIDDDDVQFMTTLAQQCAQGIERARLYEAEKNARALAEEANKAKSDFLTTMSHELRTPLNAIGGYADLIQAGIRGPVTQDQILDLERIKRSQRHLLSLINDVLNFAKLQAGIVHVAEAEFDIDNIASQVEELVMPQILERRLSYRFVTSMQQCTCRGDPEKVEQILLNLLSNAVKFTEPGGAITVSVECTPASVIVNVSDTGSGISPDKLDLVFEPFVQLNRTKSTANEGTGLGLAISRDLARAMGGNLDVVSEPGRGSTFSLRLPRAVSHA